MRTIFASFFSVWYLIFAIGVTQYAHSCKGMSVKVFSLTNTNKLSDKPCPICAAKEKGLKDKKKNCCKHESKIVKVNDGIHKQSHSDLAVKFWGDAIPNHLLGALFDAAPACITIAKRSSYFSTKVPVRETPLFIFHCNYRI